jgi:hypothetical protein
MDGKRKWESSSIDDEQVAKKLQMYYDDEKLAQRLQDQGGYSVAADLKNKAMEMETTKQINEDAKLAQLLQAEVDSPAFHPIAPPAGFATGTARAAAHPNGSRQLLPTIHNVKGAMLEAARMKRNMIAKTHYGIRDGTSCGRVGSNNKIKALVDQVMADPNFGFVQAHGSKRDIERASEELGTIFGSGRTIAYVKDGWGWAHQIRASLEPFIQERVS